jgi:hypothetical protein
MPPDLQKHRADYATRLSGHDRLSPASVGHLRPKRAQVARVSGGRRFTRTIPGPTVYRASPISSGGCAVQGVPALTTTFTAARWFGVSTPRGHGGLAVAARNRPGRNPHRLQRISGTLRRGSVKARR